MQVDERREIAVQRDMDLIRELLIRIEGDPRFDGRSLQKFDQTDLGRHSVEEVAYHLLLLSEACLLKAEFSMGARFISRLTWQGHEFLDDVRDPDIWDKTKERLKGLTGVGIAVFSEVAKAEIKKRLGLS